MLKKISPTALLLTLLIFIDISAAQTKFKGWEVFTSFKDVRSVDVRGSQVWAASTGGMFTFNVNSNPLVINKFTTQNGLRSIELSAILVDNAGSVWAGAFDGSISTYNPVNSSWRYVTDIESSNETNKKINHMFQYGNFLFIATEFSVIKFDVNFFQFVDQPYIYLGPLIAPKPPVNKTLVVNDTIWAATKYGIAYADIRNYLPIQSNWSDFTHMNSVLTSDQINTVTYFSGKVFFGTDSGMVCYANGTLSTYTPLYNGNPLRDAVIDLSVSGSSMYIGTYKTNNAIFRVDAANLNEAQFLTSGISINSLEAVPNGDVYVGTSNYGVLKNNLNNKILPDGPNSNVFFSIEVDKNQNVWGCSEGVYVYNGSSWKNYTTEFFPQMRGNNFIHLYASSNTGYLWASGFGEGLLRIKENDVFLYNEYNSCLHHYSPDFTLVEGVKEDHDGNLWVINRFPVDSLNRVIINFTNNPNCIGYPPPPGASPTLKFMAIDNYNTKWMTNHPTGDDGVSICYFNEIADSKLNIPATSLGADMTVVNDVMADNTGQIWIATDNGIAIVLDPYQVIQNPNTAPDFYKMRIIANGISTPLTENVKTVRADALNNKWIATLSNGLIYVSPDGSTILAEYNTSNSPLLDNSISTIATDPKGGKVYFGTQFGLISYQTVAVEPLTDCGKITAGPNPYLIPNDNLLRIDGLVEGSTVKILTISGTLVAEFESPGGRVANWDGRDRNGNLVATGIYIIAGFNKDASKVCTGKVAVVRR